MSPSNSPRKSVAATIAVALAAPLFVAAPADARPADCFKRGTTTLDASRSVRVFFRGRDYTSHTKYACFYRTGRTKRLGRWNSIAYRAGIGNLVAVNGRFVAYHDLRCSSDRDRGDCRSSEVRVLDARSGRVRRSAKAGPEARGLAGLAVSRKGAVAYLRDYTQPRRDLRLLLGTTDTLVASGGNLAPDSLAFAGETLFWLEGDTPRAARR